MFVHPRCTASACGHLLLRLMCSPYKPALPGLVSWSRFCLLLSTLKPQPPKPSCVEGSQTDFVSHTPPHTRVFHTSVAGPPTCVMLAAALLIYCWGIPQKKHHRGCSPGFENRWLRLLDYYSVSSMRDEPHSQLHVLYLQVIFT